MHIPFQIITENHQIKFNYDKISEPVSGKLISILRNAIDTATKHSISQDEIALNIADSFDLDFNDSLKYSEAFLTLISEDHGYFRFDDDIENENGKIHPRFHLDFFYKNSSSIKIGMDNSADIDCFYDLFSKSREKRFLRV